MKLFLASTLALGVALEAHAAESATSLTSKQERVSYALGLNMGVNLKRQNVEVTPELLIKGLHDGLSGGQQLMTEDQIRETFRELNQEITAKREQQRQEAMTRNQAEGEKFLAENAKKEGVTTLPSGLQYKVLSEGSGPSPKATDRVRVRYRGTLINGTEFDSTERQGGQPAEFRVDGVIRGWTEALQKMKQGAKWQLFIPSELAYGERGSPPVIEPNATLIFEVDLVEVIPTPEVSVQQPVTSDIIKVPSAEELKKGAKIEILKPEDVQKEIERQKAQQAQPK